MNLQSAAALAAKSWAVNEFRLAEQRANRMISCTSLMTTRRSRQLHSPLHYSPRRHAIVIDLRDLFTHDLLAQAVGFTFSWSRVSSMLVGYVVTLLLSEYGPDGVFIMIALAMLALILSVGVLGPRTNSLSLETLSQ